MKVLCMFEHGREDARVSDGVVIDVSHSEFIRESFKRATESHTRPVLRKILPQCGFLPFPKVEAEEFRHG